MFKRLCVLWFLFFLLASFKGSFAVYEPKSLGMEKIELPADPVWFFYLGGNNLNPENTCGVDGKCLRPNASNFPFGPFGNLITTWSFSASGYQNYREKAASYYYDVGKKGKPLGINGPVFFTSDCGMEISPVVQGSTTQLASNNCVKNEGGGSCRGMKVCSRKSYDACLADSSVSFKCGGEGALCTPSDGFSSWEKCNVPAYADSGSWWDAWSGLLKRIGELFRSDPQVHFGVITWGVDGEGPCTKGGKFWCPPSFGNYKKQTVETFHDSWKKKDGTMKPLLTQGTTMDTGLTAASFNPPLGMRNGLYVEDIQGFNYGRGPYGRYQGVMESVRNFYNRIPTVVEPKNAIGFGINPAQRNKLGYWYLLENLWMRPTFIDGAAQFLPMDGPDVPGTRETQPEFYSFFNRYLQVNVLTTPDVWVAMFDTAHICSVYSGEPSSEVRSCASDDKHEGNCCALLPLSGNNVLLSGKRGDLDFYLKRLESLPKNKTVVVNELVGDGKVEGGAWTTTRRFKEEIPEAAKNHPYSLHLRRTDQGSGNFYMSFDMDNDYPWAFRADADYEVSIYFLDKGGGPFYFQYKDRNGNEKQREMLRTGSNQWKKEVFVLSDAIFNDGMEGNADFRLFNGGSGKENIYLHMIKVRGISGNINRVKKKTSTICSTPATSISGNSFSVSALVLGEGGEKLGGKRVSFEVDPDWFHGERYYSAVTGGEGKASFDIPLQGLLAGAHDVKATFVGDNENFGSFSICSFTVGNGKPSTNISLSASEGVFKPGDVVKVTAQVTRGGGGVANKNVEFWSLGFSKCFATTNSSGTVSCDLKVLGSIYPVFDMVSVGIPNDQSDSGVSTSIAINTLGGSGPIILPPPGSSFNISMGWNKLNSNPNLPSCFSGSARVAGRFRAFAASYGGYSSSGPVYLRCKK